MKNTAEQPEKAKVKSRYRIRPFRQTQDRIHDLKPKTEKLTMLQINDVKSSITNPVHYW